MINHSVKISRKNHLKFINKFSWNKVKRLFKNCKNLIKNFFQIKTIRRVQEERNSLFFFNFNTDLIFSGFHLYSPHILNNQPST